MEDREKSFRILENPDIASVNWEFEMVQGECQVCGKRMLSLEIIDKDHGAVFCDNCMVSICIVGR